MQTVCSTEIFRLPLKIGPSGNCRVLGFAAAGKLRSPAKEVRSSRPGDATITAKHRARLIATFTGHRGSVPARDHHTGDGGRGLHHVSAGRGGAAALLPAARAASARPTISAAPARAARSAARAAHADAHHHDHHGHDARRGVARDVTSAKFQCWGGGRRRYPLWRYWRRMRTVMSASLSSRTAQRRSCRVAGVGG
jgi:hypothetical protein